MRSFSSVLFTPLLLCLLSACQPYQSPIGNKEYLQGIEEEYAAVYKLAEKRSEALFDVLDLPGLTNEEEDCLKFLYAGMPLNDLADYDGSYFLKMVRSALKAREEMPWGADLSPELFRHYVLPYRVNNENLDTFRLAYYDELTERVAGLSMEQAVLEINHWCHEKVSYQGADIRTSSPMSTVLSARGRCGEESTFTVMALRTVGIPARQVYTPRWAHGDDNHAWVEVFLQGEWYYLGACEPEPVLDRGWFTGPAARAMMIHTKAFGLYRGGEETVFRTNKFAEINHLKKYAKTRFLQLQVVDRNQKPVAGAKVEYGLFNYAEFYPIAVQYTDKNGYTGLSTAYGDLLVQVYKGDRYAWRKIRKESPDTLLIPLGDLPSGEQVFPFEFSAPLKVEVEQEAIPEELQKQNAERGREEDRIRKAYIASWNSSPEVFEQASAKGIGREVLQQILSRSLGNYAEMEKLLSRCPDSLASQLVSLLSEVSDKDLRDTPHAVLLNHLLNTPRYDQRLYYSKDVYDAFVLNPRIANEILSPWRSFFMELLTSEQKRSFRKNPKEVLQWVQSEFHLQDSLNYYGVPITPEGSYALGVTDKPSLQIFTIALFRSLGIPARLSAGYEEVEVYTEQGWQVLDTDKGLHTGPREQLKLKGITAKGRTDYFRNYTLSYYDGERYETLSYPMGLPIQELAGEGRFYRGHYQLITGNRLGDSLVLCRLQFLHIPQSAEVEFILEEGSVIRRELGQFTSGELELIPGVSGRKTVLAWLQEGEEPSRHLLQELQVLRKELEEQELNLVLMPLPGKQVSAGMMTGLPEGSRLQQDGSADLYARALEILQAENVRPPLILFLNEKSGILQFYSGYRIGLGGLIESFFLSP